MHILEHAPVTFLGSFGKNDIGVLFLTLTHGDVGEGTSLNGLVVGETNLLDIGSWVHTWEEHEESGSLGLSLLVEVEDVERWLFNEVNSEPLSHILNEGTGKSVGSHGSEKQQSVEECALLEGSGQFNGLCFLVHVPLTPLEGLALHGADETVKHLDLLESLDCGPSGLHDEFK